MDFHLHYTDGRTVGRLEPVTQAAYEWAHEHLPEDAPMMGGSYVIEHRYIDDIIMGILEDDLKVGRSA